MMSKITIRANILRNFIALILLITTLLLGIQYYSSDKLATEAVDRNFHQTTNNIVKYIKYSEKATEQILNILSLNPNLTHKINIKDNSLLLNNFTHILSIEPKIKGIYIGDKNDDFYEVVNIHNNPSILL